MLWPFLLIGESAMEDIQCWHCGRFFSRSPRHRAQYYCQKPECQKARKAAWKRKKLRDDPEYRLNQQASNKAWFEAHPGYWKGYRKRNPEKADRNRILQHIRNRRRAKKKKAEAGRGDPLIAKVDASSSRKIKVTGQFWMVPVIAKVDALKVYISEIPSPYH
jgi:hypothetical protein